MAKYKIDIGYPSEKMEENKRRFEATASLKPTDRAPVLFGTLERFYLRERGVGYLEFFSDSRTMLHNEIMNRAWAIENIPDDRCVDKVLYVTPWWENVVPPVSFGAEVIWLDDQPPYTKPLFSSPEEVKKFEIPAPDSGLWGKSIQYFLEWHEMIIDYDIRFNGEPGRIKLSPLNFGADGPFLMAVELVGQDFYSWLYTCPETAHLLLNKITEAFINTELYFREIDPRPRNEFYIAEDYAEMISCEMFKEFVVPYDNKLYNIFGKDIKPGRGLHNCGDSKHLLDSFVNDLRITHFLLFGSPVDPYVVSKKMGGKIYCRGNLSCSNLHAGPEEKIYEESINCLEAFSNCGNYCLADGANVAPGTPLSNLSQVIKAARDYGSFPKR